MKSTLIVPFLLLPTVLSLPLHAADTIDIGSRRELFVDHYLIGSLEGVRLVLHRPQRREIVFKFDQPWEGLYSGYETVLKVQTAERELSLYVPSQQRLCEQ